MNIEDFKYESNAAKAVKASGTTKSKGLSDFNDEQLWSSHGSRVSFPTKDDLAADYTKLPPMTVASAEIEKKVESKFDEKIEELRQKIVSEEHQAEIKAREEADCILNMKKQYDAAIKRVEDFGKDVIRAVVAEYLVHDPAHSDKVKVTNPHAALKQNVIQHLPLKSGELKVIDDHYMVYQPEYIESMHSTPPQYVLFRIPRNYFPSITEATNLELELAQEGKKLEFIPNVGQVKIDVEKFFSNYYLAKNVNTGTFRIPFKLNRNYHDEISFNVKIKLTPKSIYSVFDDYKDFDLSHLTELAKDSAKETVIGVSNYVTKMIALERDMKKLAQDSDNL